MDLDRFSESAGGEQQLRGGEGEWRGGANQTARKTTGGDVCGEREKRKQGTVWGGGTLDVSTTQQKKT